MSIGAQGQQISNIKTQQAATARERGNIGAQGKQDQTKLEGDEKRETLNLDYDRVSQQDDQQAAHSERTDPTRR